MRCVGQVAVAAQSSQFRNLARLRIHPPYAIDASRAVTPDSARDLRRASSDLIVDASEFDVPANVACTKWCSRYDLETRQAGGTNIDAYRGVASRMQNDRHARRVVVRRSFGAAIHVTDTTLGIGLMTRACRSARSWRLGSRPLFRLRLEPSEGHVSRVGIAAAPLFLVSRTH